MGDAMGKEVNAGGEMDGEAVSVGYGTVRKTGI